VCAQAAGRELAECLAVLVGKHAFEALDEAARDRAVVRAGLVRVDDAHASPSEGELMVCGLVGVQAREPTDVIAEDDVGSRRFGAEFQERTELAAPLCVGCLNTGD
jgi:hypothetical protein